MSFLDFFTAGAASAVLAAGVAGVAAAGAAAGFAGAAAAGAVAAAVAGFAGAGVTGVCAKVVTDAAINAAAIKVVFNNLSPERQKRLFNKRCNQLNR
jgi:hypothetical protein